MIDYEHRGKFTAYIKQNMDASLECVRDHYGILKIIVLPYRY